MSPSELNTFKRVVEKLGYQGKTHLNRQEVAKLIEELTLDRDYKLADYVRSLDAATIANLIR